MERLFKKEDLNELANKLKKGDQVAGGKVFDYFSPLIFRFFVARTSNRHISEDLAQDVFLKIVNKIDSFDEEIGDFTSWVWQIARNTLIDYFRSKKESTFTDVPQDLENIYKTEEYLIEKIKFNEILEVVKEFNEDEQEIFSLHYISDLSYKEIAKMTGKSEGALRVFVHRINKKIKEAINS